MVLTDFGAARLEERRDLAESHAAAMQPLSVGPQKHYLESPPSVQDSVNDDSLRSADKTRIATSSRGGFRQDNDIAAINTPVLKQSKYRSRTPAALSVPNPNLRHNSGCLYASFEGLRVQGQAHIPTNSCATLESRSSLDSSALFITGKSIPISTHHTPIAKHASSPHAIYTPSFDPTCPLDRSGLGEVCYSPSLDHVIGQSIEEGLVYDDEGGDDSSVAQKLEARHGDFRREAALAFLSRGGSSARRMSIDGFTLNTLNTSSIDGMDIDDEPCRTPKGYDEPFTPKTMVSVISFEGVTPPPAPTADKNRRSSRPLLDREDYTPILQRCPSALLYETHYE
jgi:hypothetical protein